MSGKRLSPGNILRLWRQSKGLTLEKAAEQIADHAREAGVPEKSKMVPRTYASLIRWEKDQVQMKQIGLDLIAAAYGVSSDELRKPPPLEDAPKTEQMEVPADQADAVRAFLEAMQRKAG